MGKITEATSWLLQEWLEDDNVRFTNQLADLAREQVDYIMTGSRREDLPKLS